MLPSTGWPGAQSRYRRYCTSPYRNTSLWCSLNRAGLTGFFHNVSDAWETTTLWSALCLSFPPPVPLYYSEPPTPSTPGYPRCERPPPGVHWLPLLWCVDHHWLFPHHGHGRRHGQGGGVVRQRVGIQVSRRQVPSTAGLRALMLPSWMEPQPSVPRGAGDLIKVVAVVIVV